LVEESTEIIFSLNMDMTMIYISPNVKQFLGYSSDQVIGKRLTDFLHPDDLEQLGGENQIDSNFFLTNQYLEFKLRHLNGDYRIFSSNGKLFLMQKASCSIILV
jgi:PAS domain S-box-containing protein